MSELTKQIQEMFSDEPNFRPYNIKNNIILYGAPPVPFKGINYLYSRYNNPQTKLVMCLKGTGIFVSNRDQSGIIEVGILDGSVSCAGIQVMESTGIPFPIAVIDTDSGGLSSIAASACRRVGTPEWRRDKVVGIKTFTFETPRLFISDGLRLLE